MYFKLLTQKETQRIYKQIIILNGNKNKNHTNLSEALCNTDDHCAHDKHSKNKKDKHIVNKHTGPLFVLIMSCVAWRWESQTKST